MQKGFGLIGILIVVGMIAILGVGALKTDYFSRNPFVPSAEEKSAIDMAENMKSMVEGKSNETVLSADTVQGSPSTSSGQLDTSSWKTYQNEEYGFEFRYPQSWSALEFMGTSAEKYSPPGGSWEKMGVALGKNDMLKLPKAAKSSYKEGVGDKFEYFSDVTVDYVVILESFYCGTFECSYSLSKSNPFGAINEFNAKLSEFEIQGHKAILARGGHYECYECDNSKDFIFALVCNASQDVCLRISSKQIPNDQLNLEENFLNNLISTLKLTPAFDAQRCTPAEYVCSKG